MTDYGELARVTAIMLERELEKHRSNLSDTRQVQASIDQLDGMRAAALSDEDGISMRQRIGADTLWQGWMLNKRAELLRHMAIARAREGESLGRARTAFARNQAAESLIRQEKHKARQKALKADADKMDDLSVLRRAFDAANG